MPSLFTQLRGRLGARGEPAPVEMSAGTILELRGVSARYGATIAIRDVSLGVRRGEIIAIFGANGAGKSTTLKTIIGLVAADGGSIGLHGSDISSLAPERIVERGISLTPEGRQVFGGLTVEENLRMGAGLSSQSTFEQRRAEVFELFPVLREKRNVFAGLLSGGEQQMLAIGRSLMSDPEILLLDEPSLGLAPIVVSQVFELIDELRTRGVTIVLAEQNVDKALQIADRAYVLSTGRIELEGSADELLENPDVEEAYLGLGVTADP